MEKTHIVCSSDENMVMPATAMIKSLLVNCSDIQALEIYLLDGGITNQSKNKLLKSLKPHNDKIHFIKVNADNLEPVKVSNHINIVSYYRLLIPFLLPQGVKKAIYLDTDLIINRDIAELWNIEIRDHYLLAVPEQGKNCMWVSSSDGLLNYKELGLRADQKYFNAGVLVMNLEKWRTDHIDLKVRNYIKENKEYMRWHDQDVLNAVVASSWGELDYQWNVLTQIYGNFPWNTGPIKDKKEYLNVTQSPYIIHFNTASKPWQVACEHPRRKLFFHYLDMTEWKGWRPKEFYSHELKKTIKGALKSIKRTLKARPS